MADNVAVNEGSGTTVAVAADEIAGVKHQRVKVQHGADGSATDVSSDSPLPVTLPAATVTTLTPPAAITGFATSDNQATANAALAAIQTALEILDNIVSGSEAQVDVVGALPAGTNNIGDVDIASIAAGDNNIGNVDVVTMPALPAGTNLIGRVASSDETSTIYNGTTALTPKFAVIDAATSGNNTLVAAVTSKKIRVLALMLVAGGTVNVRFESGADGTALSGQMQLTAQTGFSLPHSPTGWFETASGTLLNLELSAAVSVDGMLVYVEV